MTLRNVERSGKRHVTRTSTLARRIEGVRHIDCDLIQYCPKCHEPEVFCEVKRYLVSDKEWQLVRMHAKHWGRNCIALLIIEADNGSLGIKLYDPFDDTLTGVHWGGDELLIDILNQARDLHGCYV